MKTMMTILLILTSSVILTAGSPEFFGGIFFAADPGRLEKNLIKEEVQNGLFFDINGDYQGGRLSVGIIYNDETLMIDSSASVRALPFQRLKNFGPEIEGGIGIRTRTSHPEDGEPQSGSVYSFLGIGGALRLNRFYCSLNYRYIPFSIPVPGQEGLPPAENRIRLALGIGF